MPLSLFRISQQFYSFDDNTTLLQKSLYIQAKYIKSSED